MSRRARPARRFASRGAQCRALAGRHACDRQPVEIRVGTTRPRRLRSRKTERDDLAAMAYRRYQDNLKRVGTVDFDDLLLLTEELFANSRRCCRAEARRFDHLLVDEYQDTNGSQYRIIQGSAAGHRNLCVVGDDDQSIYGWRGRRGDAHSAIRQGLARGQGRAARRQLPVDGRDS